MVLHSMFGFWHGSSRDSIVTVFQSSMQCFCTYAAGASRSVGCGYIWVHVCYCWTALRGTNIAGESSHDAKSQYT